MPIPILAAALLGCSAPAPVVPPPDPVELKVHMQGHLASVTAVRNALVLGDLAAAKAANRAFLDHSVAFDLPGDWVRHVTTMGEAAVALDRASDVAAASGHAAEVAAACGQCHREVGAAVEVPRSPHGEGHGPTESYDVEGLWLALISPDVHPAPQGATSPAAAGQVLAACANCHAAER